MVEKLSSAQEASEQNGNENEAAQQATSPQTPNDQASPNPDSQNTPPTPGAEPMDTTTPNEVSFCFHSLSFVSSTFATSNICSYIRISKLLYEKMSYSHPIIITIRRR
jgi:hypothetical protein